LTNHKEEKAMNKKEKLEKMAEMMKSCCTGVWGMGDSCSRMRKLMNQEERDEKKETEGPLKDGSCV
jgi:hypothetical protein